MPTNRDLAEAHAFSRRRLVTACVSGAPGGREVEPHRPGRVLVAGAASAVVLLAGAAVVGILTGRPGDDWLGVGLVVSEDTGTAYVITDGDDPVLRPVVNNTSARLALGADLRPTMVPQSDIDAQTVGDEIGILGAPPTLPAAEQLVAGGWTACTAAGAGVRVRLADVPGVGPQPGAAMVLRVRGSDDHLLVAPASDRFGGEPRALRYALPADAAQRDRLLRALDLPESAAAVEVDAGFVRLFPEGSALAREAFGLVAEGTPVGYGGGAFAGLVVGDLVAAGGDTFLLADQGPVTLDPFAAALAVATAGGGAPTRVTTVGATIGPEHPTDWPDTALTPVGGDLCAALVARAEESPRVVIGPPDRADAAAGGVAPGESAVDVPAGRAALVRGGEGQRFVVDAQGVRHRLVGTEAVDDLGYADHAAQVVPDSWLALLPCGVDLSREAALRPPATAAGGCR